MKQFTFKFRLVRTSESTHVVSGDDREQALALAIRMMEQEEKHELANTSIELIEEKELSTIVVPRPDVKANPNATGATHDNRKK